jgi:hypothetical protein
LLSSLRSAPHPSPLTSGAPPIWMPGAPMRMAMVMDRTRPKEEEDRFAFKPLENHVIFVLSYLSCTFYGKPPRIIPPDPFTDLSPSYVTFASTV